MRDRIRIIKDILSLAKESTKKTHILYRVNLSHSLRVKYTSILVSNGLLRKNNNGEYQTTQKGLIFLDLHKKIYSLLTQRSMLEYLNIKGDST